MIDLVKLFGGFLVGLFRPCAACAAEIIPPAGFRLLYGIVIPRPERRRLARINAAANPTAESTAQQITEALPWNETPQYLIRDRPMNTGATRQRGFALLIVLWTLALLALLGTHLLEAARGETQLARNLVDAADLEAAANGAVQQAIFGLRDNSNRRWQADGSTHLLTVGRALVAVRVESEVGKVNPNFASAMLLQALARAVGADPAMATQVANAIAATRSSRAFGTHAGPGSVVTAPEGGVEFSSIDGLATVPGMTAELLSRLRPHMTTFTDNDPDTGTRDPVVAQALFMAGEARGGGGTNSDIDVVSVYADARMPGNARLDLHVVVRNDPDDEQKGYDIISLARE